MLVAYLNLRLIKKSVCRTFSHFQMLGNYPGIVRMKTDATNFGKFRLIKNEATKRHFGSYFI